MKLQKYYHIFLWIHFLLIILALSLFLGRILSQRIFLIFSYSFSVGGLYVLSYLLIKSFLKKSRAYRYFIYTVIVYSLLLVFELLWKGLSTVESLIIINVLSAMVSGCFIAWYDAVLKRKKQIMENGQSLVQVAEFIINKKDNIKEK